MRAGSSTISRALRVATTRWGTNGKGCIQEAKGRGGISGQEAAEHREDERGRWHDVSCCDNQLEAEAKPPPPPPPPRLCVSKNNRGVTWNSKEQSYGASRY